MDNHLGRTREESATDWIYHFANGLVVHTDPFWKPGEERILPIGGPQDAILNHLVAFPDKARGKRVFDPFSGSGIFGLMALQLGADHVDFLDVNPRARDFQQANAARNGFAPDRFTTHLESIERFDPGARYDLVLANPPFVPTPPAIRGTLTSAAGEEGNDLAIPLLRMLHGCMKPDAEALVYLMQLEAKTGPLVTRSIELYLGDRHSRLTPTQAEAIPMAVYCEAYRECFPDQSDGIDRWREDLERRHGEVAVQHYVLHVSAPSGGDESGAGVWEITDDLESKYGVDRYAAESNAELALGRVLENVMRAAPD
jgi:hypothetical protein